MLRSELRCTRIYLNLAVFGLKISIVGTKSPQYVRVKGIKIYVNIQTEFGQNPIKTSSK